MGDLPSLNYLLFKIPKQRPSELCTSKEKFWFSVVYKEKSYPNAQMPYYFCTCGSLHWNKSHLWFVMHISELRVMQFNLIPLTRFIFLFRFPLYQIVLKTVIIRNLWYILIQFVWNCIEEKCKLKPWFHT